MDRRSVNWTAGSAELVGDAERGDVGSDLQILGRRDEARAAGNDAGRDIGIAERDRSEFGIAIARADQPARPQHGLDAAADRPAGLGESVGEGEWHERDWQSGRTKRRAAARTLLEMLPGYTAGQVGEKAWRDEIADAPAQAGVPGGANAGRKARRRTTKECRNSDAAERRRVVRPADVALDPAPSAARPANCSRRMRLP